MANSRRSFLKGGAFIGSAVSAFAAPTAQSGQETREGVLPTAKARQLMALFDLKYPIFQAPHAGAGSELVAAVSNAGAMGILGGLNRLSGEAVHELVKITRQLTKRLFAVNYLLAFDSESFARSLDAGAPIVHFSWGLPTKAMMSTLRSAGAKCGVQVANAAGARAALDLGADYLVCQGVEAGGHVQSSTALYDLLPTLLEEARGVPVNWSSDCGPNALMRRSPDCCMGRRQVGKRNLVPQNKRMQLRGPRWQSGAALAADPQCSTDAGQLPRARHVA